MPDKCPVMFFYLPETVPNISLTPPRDVVQPPPTYMDSNAANDSSGGGSEPQHR